MKSGKESGAAKMQPATSSTTGNRPNTASNVLRSLQWWPTLAGIALAGFVALNMSSATEPASILAAVCLVYLGAAALQMPSAAWPLFFVTFIIITADRLGLVDIDATWVLLGGGGLFVAYGILRGATRPAGGLPLQTIAMVVFGGAAAIALLINQVVGAYMVAAGLLAHSGWDAYHHWTNRVVSRSLAEFCFVLDALLALAIVVVMVGLV
jgi:hypothetical protein